MCGRARCTLRPQYLPTASHRHSLPSRFLNIDRFGSLSKFQSVERIQLCLIFFEYCLSRISYRPSYNVAPGSYMPILRRDNESGDVVQCMKWGLIPSFSNKTDKPDFFKMFNARSETVAEKASFRRLLSKNRCIVAVDGFYEWKKQGSKKQPYYIHFKDGRPLVFAALFDSWQDSTGETLYTFTILTTASSTALNWLHDRMPVILGDKDSIDTWLDDPSTSKLKPLLAPYENSDLVWYPVTSAIGKPTFDGPECIQQIPLKATQNGLISKFFSAKHPKTQEGDQGTKPTDENIQVGLREEDMVKGYDSIKKNVDNYKEIQDEAKDQKITKAEPFLEDNLTFAPHLESVKSEAKEGINTVLPKETGESNASTTAEPCDLDISRISKGESEAKEHCSTTIDELNQFETQHDDVQYKQKEGGFEFSGNCCSGQNGTKRGFEVFSGQEKPLKASRDDKSSGKQGKKKGKEKSYNMKKSKEEEKTQSTLHFFFDQK
ncbi:unnamed protein product [Cochlearia groenlandica]